MKKKDLSLLIASKTTRLIISLFTCIALWFALNGNWGNFLTAIVPVLIQILLNDFSYKTDNQISKAEVAASVVELMATKVPISPSLSRNTSNQSGLAHTKEHYDWLLKNNIITNTGYKYLANSDRNRRNL